MDKFISCQGHARTLPNPKYNCYISPISVFFGVGGCHLVSKNLSFILLLPIPLQSKLISLKKKISFKKDQLLSNRNTWDGDKTISFFTWVSIVSHFIRTLVPILSPKFLFISTNWKIIWKFQILKVKKKKNPSFKISIKPSF